MNPENNYQQYQRTTVAYELTQWACGIGALGLVLTAAIMPGQHLHQTRAAAALGGIGLCIIGNSTRREYEEIANLTDNIRQAIAANAVAWTHTLTQPTRTALRQSQLTQESLNPLPLFDWTGLADSDEHPVIAIVSPMGGGKSRLAKWLAKHVLFPAQAVDLAAIDIYGRKKDWPTIAPTANEILELMRDDLLILESRECSYRDGANDFEPMFRIFEECPDTLSTLSQVKDAKRVYEPWLMKYATTTRKVKARLCLVSVKLAGATIGISAESRDDATIIFPGMKGISKAMGDDRMLKLGTKANQLLRERLLTSLEGLRHPALLFHQGQWYPASIPELDAHGNPAGQTYHPELAEYLDSLTSYLKSKGTITSRELKKNWGRNNGANAQTVDQLLSVLENYQKITHQDGIIEWRENAP